MRKTLVLALLLVCGAVAGPLWLCRIDGMSGRDAASAGIPVVMELPGYCLAWLEPAQYQAMSNVTALESDQPGRCWLYVMPDPSLDRSLLSQFGTVLTEDSDGLVLGTTEDHILDLNRMQVELAGIGEEPMAFTEPPVPQPVALPDSLIWQLVARVSTDSLEANLRRLIAFRTRYTTTESCYRALLWARSKLVAAGCDSTKLDTFRTGYTPNVVGRKLGTVHPNRIFVVCGHVDNTSETPSVYAPGSDDNASGAGVMLEVARVFADMAFDNTVLFIGFSGEEQGLVGSDSFVHRAKLRGDSIMVAMNFDMVSYGLVDSITVVYTSILPQTEQLADFYVAQADTFTDLKCRKMLLNDRMSDHNSFWNYGYPAIRGRYRDRTPCYHTTGDTIGPFHYTQCGTNNLPLYTEVVKATVATLAKWAGAHRMTGMEESANVECRMSNFRPFLVRGTLLLPPSHFTIHYSLFDPDGRRVAELQPGANDVSRLSPGVYFVRTAQAQAQAQAQAVAKVILTR